MDDWAWEQLAPWLDVRVELPVGPLFCVVNGATRGRPWAAAAARTELRRVAREAGARRRFAPHQLRHAHSWFEDDGAAAPFDCLRERFRGSCERIGGSDVDVELALRERRGEQA